MWVYGHDFFNAGNIEDLYAFHYNPQEDKLVQSAGWQVYDIAAEFIRMETPSEFWVETKLNKDFKVCFIISEIFHQNSYC